MTYLRNHWLGDQPLFRSFWINLLLIRFVILYAEQFTRPPYIADLPTATAAAIAYFILFQLVVLPWQVVGVLRSCDRHLSRYRAIAWIWGVQFGIAASLVLTLIGVYAGFQTLLHDWRQTRDAASRQPQAGTYTLTLIDGGRRIRLNGSFDFGITRDLEALLWRHHAVEGIVLGSDGGQVYEGRGVARLIAARGLNTYVFETCKSACATAFIGGATRILGPRGRLGFHQYRLAAEFANPLVDVAAEQDRDRRFYAEQNIADGFLRVVFDRPHDEIWFPDVDTLLAAGVIHRVADPPPAD